MRERVIQPATERRRDRRETPAGVERAVTAAVTRSIGRRHP